MQLNMWLWKLVLSKLSDDLSSVLLTDAEELLLESAGRKTPEDQRANLSNLWIAKISSKIFYTDI